ncbi:SWT1 protein, partial [Polypterus senegalus]
MLLAEELHVARSEKRLEVDVVNCYGELTSMDIDLPEEDAKLLIRKKNLAQNLLIVLDTNILLSHLDFIRMLKEHGIPDGLSIENNDDRVLQCCLQYQNMYPNVNVVLCTNDKNLCCKAMLSGVKAVSKSDLIIELENLGNNRCVHSSQDSQNTLHQKKESFSRRCENKEELQDNNNLSTCDVASVISTIKESLRKALSMVLETEMKIAFDNLWTERKLALFLTFFVHLKEMFEKRYETQTVQYLHTTQLPMRSKAIFETFNYPCTLEAVLPDTNRPTPHEAFVCLQKLMLLGKELLNAFERVLETNVCFEDVQALHNCITNCEITSVDQRFTAQRLYECISQYEYRKKLEVGKNQLAELSYNLERCNTAICTEARNMGWI